MKLMLAGFEPKASMVAAVPTTATIISGSQKDYLLCRWSCNLDCDAFVPLIFHHLTRRK